jgi:hypothetical protein
LAVPLLLRMEDVRLASDTNDTICRISSATVSGCYSCPGCATLTYTCQTDFGSTLAQLECPEFTVAQPCHQNTVGDNQTAIVFFSHAAIDMACLVRCPGGTTSFQTTGHLHFLPPDLPALPALTAVSSAGNSSQPGLSVFEWLAKLAEFDPFGSLALLFQAVARAAMIGVALLATAIICLILFKLKLIPKLWRTMASRRFVGLPTVQPTLSAGIC